ncbi:MAG: InlB B-repeat-containing protein, partial [Clostridia bacterium]|nr:InlB B-repeat-containing protein [Clostridia bacterium]
MKKAFKISAVLVALVVIAMTAFVFTSSAAEVSTLDEFKAALVEDGATVVLKADIGTETDVEVFKVGANVTIDLNGHKILSGVTGGLFLQEGVALPGTLTVKDSVGGGAIVAPTATLFDNFGGTIKITAGTYVADGLLVTGEGKTTPVVTISGTDDATKGTWTSFDPSNWLVYGYSVKDVASTANAAAVNCVYPTVYTIKYTVPAGASHTNITTYTVETDTIVLSDAYAQGYEFKGWFVKENGVEQAISYVNTKTHLYDLEVVGKFEAKVYNINYGGEGYTNNPNNPATFTVDKPNIKLGAPTKAGYQFLGWYTEPNGAGEAVTEIKCSTTFEDVTVYPHFEAIIYQITYVTYIEGFDENTLKHDYTVEDEFDFDTVSKLGYTFKGWYNSAIPSSDDQPITGIKKGTTGNIIVYAQYDIVTYKINYGESEQIVTDYATFPKEYTIETPTFALPTPEVKPGYSFIGWKDATDTIVTIVPVGSVGDLDLEPVIEKT